MFSISFKENNLLTLIIKLKIFFARAIITPTACASSVSMEFYIQINTRAVLGQSAMVYCAGKLMENSFY